MSNSRADDDSEKTALVVAISSRALFDLDQSHRVFESEGLEAYARYQIEREDELLEPGCAFPLVRKLLRLNGLIEEGPKVEVILLSRNSSDTGLRIFNSIEHYQLDIVRAAFTNGASRFSYIESFGADLFLSSHSDDVRQALEAGYAAATILPSAARGSEHQELRIAFDGDAVLFSDESERISTEQGLEAFAANESRQAQTPLPGGPFKPFLSALMQIQQAFPPAGNPIRTALVTARSAPAHKRVILTLRHWGIRIDEALFLGGRDKGLFLKAFGADIFFDDQRVHIESASPHVTTGHVPHGVKNEQ
jgi:5'-nucleotidase